MYLRLTLFLLIIPYSSYAVSAPYTKPYARPYEEEEAEIPKKPSTPPALTQKVPTDIPHCERYFVYQGHTLECDSNVGKDAERLRSLMQDVPNALAELDQYQSNQKQIKVAAYLGSLGLLVALAGILIKPPFDKVSGAPLAGGFVILGGLGLSVNSFIYGLSLMKANEAHIGTAVDLFNSAHPDRPIQLQFSAQINF